MASNIPMIRCVAIDPKWPVNRTLILRCLKETYVRNKGTRLIAPVDYAPEEDIRDLRRYYEIIELKDGKPPRMNRLLEMALKMIEGPLVWTCEQDAILHNDQRDMAEAVFKNVDSNIVCLELQSMGENGHLTHPSPKARMKGAWKGLALTSFATFSCTLWRTEALKKIKWDQCRPHHGCDINVSDQLHRVGYGLGMSRTLWYTHFGSLSWRQRK